MRYPTAHAYLARLPGGVEAYPECRAKASLLRDMGDSRPIDAAPGDLPRALTDLLDAPPPVSSWIPEVLFNAAALAMYDQHFGGTDIAGFEQWVCDFNRKLFAKPLYRILFALVSPRRLLTLAASRWHAFHRGSTLTVSEPDRNVVHLSLQFPEALFAEPMLRAFGGAWRAAVLTAGAHQARSDVLSTTTRRADYAVTWS
jgi:hypothetical protein